MAQTIQLKFSKPVTCTPTASPSGRFEELRHHDSFCAFCTNFDRGAADELLLIREELWLNDLD
jgi:hypothetical protein